MAPHSSLLTNSWASAAPMSWARSRGVYLRPHRGQSIGALIRAETDPEPAATHCLPGARPRRRRTSWSTKPMNCQQSRALILIRRSETACDHTTHATNL